MVVSYIASLKLNDDNGDQLVFLSEQRLGIFPGFLGIVNEINCIIDFQVRNFWGNKMATSGPVMSSRTEKGKEEGKLGVEGKALMTPRPPEKDGNNQVTLEVPSPPSSSRPSSTSTSGTTGEFGEPLGALQLPPEAMGVLETVVNMNRTLEHQIDALRLKIDVDAKQYDMDRKKIVHDKDKQIKVKQTEIEILKATVRDREGKIKVLESQNDEKDSEIQDKLEEIQDLKAVVEQTEDYAGKLSKKLDKLKLEKKHLESDSVYKQQNEEIRRLRHELVAVRDKLIAMEKELNRAKHVIEQQGHKIKLLEFEKSEMNARFKDELEKASRAMRQEVERMREVMKAQYEEMRNLREQNKEISNDVRDIKDLLLKNTRTPRDNDRETIDVNNFSPTPSHSGRQTFLNPNPQPARSSMPNMKVTHTKSGLPPLTRENTSGANKWVPAGARRSMNALSAKHKK
ncbi:hypothetical protein FSP39_001693 [Pinctada imbricata]|uniref:Uncharacterized protein n=1 Tax=Pinctada imbricata TaxID=66713 RepID=A0AA89BVQ3_PINIB|nr:hypothetical protein FSP39_001693 [Pinctada imbricata]